LSLM